MSSTSVSLKVGEKNLTFRMIPNNRVVTGIAMTVWYRDHLYMLAPARNNVIYMGRSQFRKLRIRAGQRKHPREEIDTARVLGSDLIHVLCMFKIITGDSMLMDLREMTRVQEYERAKEDLDWHADNLGLPAGPQRTDLIHKAATAAANDALAQLDGKRKRK